MKKIIYVGWMRYLQRNNKITNPSEYRKKKITTDHLTQMSNHSNNNFKNTGHTIVIFFYLQAA